MTTYGPSIEVSLAAFNGSEGPLYIGNCDGCDEPFIYNSDDGEHFHVSTVWNSDEIVVEENETQFMWSEFYEKEFCNGCVEGEYPSTIVRVEAETGEKTKVTFTDCEVSADWDVDVEWFYDIGFVNRRYVNTDGWRGYHDTGFDNLTEVESGWVTGDWGDAISNGKRDFHRFTAALEDGSLIPPVDLFIVLEPTSNVFSTACGLWARTEDADALKDWLAEEIEFDLHGALG